MRTLASVLLLALLFAACAPSARIPLRQEVHLSPITVLSSSPYPVLKARIDSLLSDTLFPPSNIGIKIVSLSRDEVLYELNPRILFNPASNQKLYTSAAALALLGENFPLSTIVSLDSASRMIFVKGYGDPILSTSDMDSIARVIAGLIPHKGPWTLAGDVTYFDSVYWGQGWAWDDEPESYGMFISPLCLDHNAIVVKARPGRSVGDQVRVETDPETDFVTIQNCATTVGDSAVIPLVISRRWQERTNIITATGEMRQQDSIAKEELSVWQPERYALAVLAERLRSLGLTVDSLSIDTVRSGARELLRYSHGVDSVVTYLNKVSDNLSAEVLLKTLAAERYGSPGTAGKGLSVIKEFIAGFGVDTSKIVMADGSGLSRYNLLSPATTTKLLEGVYKGGRHFDAFLRSLPIAGIDGTLKNRMGGSLAESNLRAKTGTLSTVTTLSGYVRTAENELLAFSIMMQHAPNGTEPYRAIQDKIGILLSGMKREEL